MTALIPYATGTISIGANATSVVGVSTLWSGVNVKPGDRLSVAGHEVTVIDVVDTTHLTIEAWPYSAVAGGTAYKIWQVSPLRFAGGDAMLEITKFVAALNTEGMYVVVKPTETVPNPSLGTDNQFAFQVGTGKLWLKTGGAWVYQGAYKGFAIKGAWSGATAYVESDVVSLNGSSYICILAHTNHTPPNVTYWELLASVGGVGATGPAAWLPPVAWLTATAYTIGPPASVVVQGGETYVCIVSHTSGTFATDLAANKWIKVSQKGTGDLRSTNNLSDLPSISTAVKNLGLRLGQCILSKVSTNLVLTPRDGNLLTVNGVANTVPDAGVSLAATGLTPGTLYYIYATATGGAINALQASTTAPAISTTAGNKGVKIKTGDDTRTLVGMARPITGPAWQDAAAQRFVRSYFNEPGVAITGAATTAAAGASTTYVEVATAARAEFLLWSGEIVDVSCLGTMTDSSGPNSMAANIGIDSASAVAQEVAMNNYATSARCGFNVSYAASGLAEGYHYATPLLRSISASAATFNSAAGALINGITQR